MDPSHIHRAGENPSEAIAAVMSRVKHVHIRDCKGMQSGPASLKIKRMVVATSTCLGFVRVLHEHGYDGALNSRGHRRQRTTAWSSVAPSRPSREGTCRHVCRLVGRGSRPSKNRRHHNGLSTDVNENLDVDTCGPRILGSDLQGLTTSSSRIVS